MSYVITERCHEPPCTCPLSYLLEMNSDFSESHFYTKYEIFTGNDPVMKVTKIRAIYNSNVVSVLLDNHALYQTTF